MIRTRGRLTLLAVRGQLRSGPDDHNPANGSYIVSFEPLPSLTENR